MSRLIFVICLLVVTACQRESPVSPTPIDRRVVLAPGEAAPIASGLALRFLRVDGDSRCPADALCVLGGDAVVRIEIVADGQTAERELHTGNNQPVTYGGLRIELLQLAPYPFSARPIEPGEYRATLLVTGQ